MHVGDFSPIQSTPTGGSEATTALDPKTPLESTPLVQSAMTPEDLIKAIETQTEIVQDLADNFADQTTKAKVGVGITVGYAVVAILIGALLSPALPVLLPLILVGVGIGALGIGIPLYKRHKFSVGFENQKPQVQEKLNELQKEIPKMIGKLRTESQNASFKNRRLQQKVQDDLSASMQKLQGLKSVIKRMPELTINSPSKAFEAIVIDRQIQELAQSGFMIPSKDIHW